MKVTTVVGARPQFIKAATVARAIEAHNGAGKGPQIVERIVHTGRHYDENMPRVFFEELYIPRPAANLEVGSGTPEKWDGHAVERIADVFTMARG